MSLAPRSVSHPSLAGREPRPVEVAPQPARRAPKGAISSVAVTWRLTRRSLGERAPAGSARLLDLVVRVEGLDSGRVSASVIATDPASRASAVIGADAPERAEVIADIRDHVHVECPGVLHATIARDGAGWVLVYARTPVLADLAIPGGRAEPAGVSVRTV